MLDSFIDLLFPRYCVVCRTCLVKNESWICTLCFVDLPLTNYHLEIDNPLAQKFYGKFPTTYAMSLYKFRVGNGVQRLVHQLKYGNQPAIGEMLGKIYGAQLLKQNWKSYFDCIIPVPLHRRKLRERGYNQSDYFAKGIADLLSIPWHSHCLERVKNTTTQTQKGKTERLNNLLEAFCVREPQLIRDKHVLLVDDIVTTGATLEACAAPLLLEGVKEISIATIGVVD